MSPANKNETKDKTKTAAKNDKPVKAPKGVHLPILWETVNTLSKIIITLLGFAMFLVSYLNGVSLVMCAIRAGAAMLGVGLILWAIYWMVARGSVDLAHDLLVQRQSEMASKNSGSNFMEFGA